MGDVPTGSCMYGVCRHHRLPPPPDKNKRSHFKLCRGRLSIHPISSPWPDRSDRQPASQPASPHLIVGREGGAGRGGVQPSPCRRAARLDGWTWRESRGYGASIPQLSWTGAGCCNTTKMRLTRPAGPPPSPPKSNPIQSNPNPQSKTSKGGKPAQSERRARTVRACPDRQTRNVAGRQRQGFPGSGGGEHTETAVLGRVRSRGRRSRMPPLDLECRVGRLTAMQMQCAGSDGASGPGQCRGSLAWHGGHARVRLSVCVCVQILRSYQGGMVGLSVGHGAKVTTCQPITPGMDGRIGDAPRERKKRLAGCVIFAGLPPMLNLNQS